MANDGWVDVAPEVAAKWNDGWVDAPTQDAIPSNARETERGRRKFVATEGTFMEQAKEPFRRMTREPIPAENFLDYITTTIPDSANRLMYGSVMAPYSIAKGITDPILQSGDVIGAIKNTGNAVQGLAQYTARPFGLSNEGLQGAKDAWSTDPVGSLAVVLPALKATKGAAADAISLIPEQAEMSLYQRGLKGQNGLASGLKKTELDRRINTALNEGVPLTPSGLDKLKSVKNEINTEVKQRIADYAKSGETVSIDNAMLPVNAVKAKAAGTAFPEGPMRQIRKVENEFLRNAIGVEDNGLNAATTGSPDRMPIASAQAKKVSINAELDDFYKAIAASPDKTAMLQKAWTNKTKAAVADGLRAEISEIFPEVKSLNRREGNLIQLQKSLERAVNRIGQRDLISLKSVVTLGESPKLWLMQYVLNNPKIQSHIAIAIRQARNNLNGNAPAYVSPGLYREPPQAQGPYGTDLPPRVPTGGTPIPEPYGNFNGAVNAGGLSAVTEPFYSGGPRIPTSLEGGKEVTLGDRLDQQLRNRTRW